MSCMCCREDDFGAYMVIDAGETRQIVPDRDCGAASGMSE